MRARTATVIAVAALLASIALGAMLAWVLLDPQRWFGDDFVAKPTAAHADDSEKAEAINAVVNSVESRCVNENIQIDGRGNASTERDPRRALRGDRS
jgi:hypothetical protein